MLAQIINLVQQAQTTKPTLARLADQVAARFVPAVMALAVLTALGWFFWGPEPKIAYMTATSLAVLMIACP